MTERMIAHCGLICTDCDGYKAARTMDLEMARATAEAWSRQYNTTVKVDDVWCDGCLVEGKKCAHCAECEIRMCALKREVENCGACPDFACDKLEAFFKMVPFARANLE